MKWGHLSNQVVDLQMDSTIVDSVVQHLQIIAV